MRAGVRAASPLTCTSTTVDKRRGNFSSTPPHQPVFARNAAHPTDRPAVPSIASPENARILAKLRRPHDPPSRTSFEVFHLLREAISVVSITITLQQITAAGVRARWRFSRPSAAPRIRASVDCLVPLSLLRCLGTCLCPRRSLDCEPSNGRFRLEPLEPDWCRASLLQTLSARQRHAFLASAQPRHL